MSIEMSKGKRILFLITIMLTNIVVMGEVVLSPVFNDFYEAYPDHIGIVNTILSLPQIVIIAASLVASMLLNKLSKKTVLIIGGVLFAVSAIFGVAVDNVYYILALRIPYGIGTAFVNVAAIALIAEVYVDENKRGAVMGYYNAFMSGIGVVMGVIAGLFAVDGWKNAYKTFYSAIPMLIMFVLFLPSIKPAAAEEVSKESTSSKKEAFGKKFILLNIAFILINIAIGMIMYYVSTYVVENALGNAATSGYLTSVNKIGGFVCCLFFGKLYEKFGGKLVIGLYALSTLCFVLLWLCPNLVIAYITFFLFGGIYGMAFAFAYAHSSTIIPESRIDDSVGIVTAVASVGCFLTTYYATFAMDLLGSFLITPVFGITAALCAIATVIELVNNKK